MPNQKLTREEYKTLKIEKQVFKDFRSYLTAKPSRAKARAKVFQQKAYKEQRNYLKGKSPKIRTLTNTEIREATKNGIILF